MMTRDEVNRELEAELEAMSRKCEAEGIPANDNECLRREREIYERYARWYPEYFEGKEVNE